MFENKLFNKTNISFLIFLFVNSLFSIKYLSRYTSKYILITFLIILFYFFIWLKKDLITNVLKFLKIKNIYIVLIYIVVVSFVFYLIPKETLHVDRWSVIASFWDNYFNGKYVYFAQSFDGNYPGPMPFYFILALPFYIIGELGIFSVLGIFVFMFLMKNKKKSNITSMYFILTASSLFYIWEVCSRSNIFINGVLILYSIICFFKNYQKKLSVNILFGIIFGLLISTRNVFVIPYIITFLFALRTKIIDFKNLLIVMIIAFLVFAIVFLPFVLNHFDDFMKMNPFIIQSNYLMPFKYSLIFLLLAFIISFFIKAENDIYYFSGLILFFTILFYFVYIIFSNNFELAFFESKADISYFILCLPFSMYYLFISEK
ncbi:MAG: oligosaccharide repeat unit polymerase [Flavobacterium sp.]|nr:oligosaccharide repeat unit polymerase [Flavobacterium sp.]